MASIGAELSVLQISKLISPTFYAQLLRGQIPKIQKTEGLTLFLRFWDL